MAGLNKMSSADEQYLKVISLRNRKESSKDLALHICKV